MVIPACLTVVSVVINGRHEFRTTGDPSEEARWIGDRGEIGRNLLVGRGLSIAVESVVAVLLTGFAICTHNVYLLAMSVGMLAGPVYTFVDWEDYRFVWLRHLPLSLLIGQLMFLTFPAFGFSAWASNVMMIHF